MGLFRDRWDSENYPSYEDYMDAKRSGTLKKYSQLGNTQSSSEKKARMSTDSPYSKEARQGSLESQMATLEAKSQAARDENKKADAKRYRNTDAKYGTPKPFTGKLPNVQMDKKKQFKGLAVLIAIVIGILPSFSKLLDSLSEDIGISEWINSIENSEPTGSTDEATAEAVEHNQYLTTALPADFLSIRKGLIPSQGQSTSVVQDILKGKSSTIQWGVAADDKPYLDISTEGVNQSPLQFSNFIGSAESTEFFNEDGSLKSDAYMDIVLTDLTNDGYKDIIVYYGNDTVNPFIEVYYNTQNGSEIFKALEPFESYKTLNVTDKGIIQRIDDDGKIYDECEVTSEGVYVVEQ